MKKLYIQIKKLTAIAMLSVLLISPAIIKGQQALQTPLLTPEVSIDPSFAEGWIWVDGTYQWTTTISNIGTSSLQYEFPGFATGSPPPGYITDVNPATGIIPTGGSEEVLISWDASGYSPGDYFQDLHCETNDPLNPDVYIENLMHVYSPAYLGGIVTDVVTNQPINGATITAGVWQTQTLNDGSYVLAVNEGTYIVYYDKVGYEPTMIADTSTIGGDTTYIDVEMMPVSYPVPWVLAESICNEVSPAEVSWGDPIGFSEIIYDDGTAEDFFVWDNAGGESAVRFSPSGYPANVIGGSIYTDNGWPGGNWLGSEFRVLVYDEDVNGFPGNALDSILITVSNYNWIEFTGLDVSIISGDFFLSVKQLNPGSEAAPIGIDTGTPPENRSYTKISGGTWGLAANPDFMIRAYLEEPTSNPVGYYIVARMSDFDPNVGPQSGTMTTLINSPSSPYIDDFLETQPEAWYAYAVQTIYASGGTSPWEYSNVIGNNLGNIVTFIISDCLLGPDEGFVVSAYGLDYPYEVFVDTTDINGMCVFDCMWAGNYDYTITRCGYDDIMDNITVSQDITVEITPFNILYKPRTLNVDSVSGIASWEEPLITAILEDFEGSQMPPIGWQMTTNGDGWMQTDDGSSPGFIIPPTGSSYACVNDDDAGAWNDGCCDMLITPLLDLCESDNYILSFDSYFTGANGQLATVEYSLDAGANWTNLYTLSPVAGVWEHIEIDLSAFSGANAADDFLIAFHADDGGGQASGWAIDNVDIHAGLPEIDIQGYHVFLDGAFVIQTDTSFYPYNDLTYGVTYNSCVAAFYDCGLSDYICTNFTSYYLREPNWLQGDTLSNNVELMWEMDTFGITSVILGYNVYRDSVNIAYVPFTGEDTSYYTDILPDPMCYDYHISTLHDLSTYGFPGDTGESLYTGPEEICIVFGTTLPYNQDWTSGSFEPEWTAGDNWVINGQLGNPEPSAEFTWDPILQNYSSVLLSGAFNGVFPETKGDPYEDGNFILKYDVKLNDLNASGDEHFLCEVWAEGVWHTVASYDNADGSFDWLSEEIDITEITFGKVFNVRFVAEGLNSSDILSWNVDNISIERVCAPPRNLFAYGYSDYIIDVNWSPPEDDLKDRDKNWDGILIKDAVASSVNEQKRLVQMYEIYYNFNGTGYELIETTSDTFYFHNVPFIEYGDLHCYYIKAVYDDCDANSNEACWAKVIGIDENMGTEIITIFPNPSNDLINIESAYGITHLCLMDYSGRMLECHKLSNETQYSIDVSNYELGVYLLRIDTEMGRVVRKVVITE